MSGVDFWRAVTRNGRAPCWACEVWPGDKGKCKHLSAGILDAHHLIAKQTVKREFPGGVVLGWSEGVEAWLRDPGLPPYRPEANVTPAPRRSLDDLRWDPRIGVPLARWHHDQVEQHRREIPRALLPPGVEEFADELRLGWLLDRTYGPKEAAA